MRPRDQSWIPAMSSVSESASTLLKTKAAAAAVGAVVVAAAGVGGRSRPALV